MKIDLSIPSLEHEFDLLCDVAVFNTLLFLNESQFHETPRLKTVKWVQNNLYTYGLIDGNNAHDFPDYKVYFGLVWAKDFVEGILRLTELNGNLDKEECIRTAFREMMNKAVFKTL